MLPAGLLNTPVGNLIQQNALPRYAGDALRPWSRFRADAKKEKLPPHTGVTQTFTKLGLLDVNLKPAPAVGAPDLANFTVESYTAAPQPYANTVQVNAKQNYVQTVGNDLEQKIKRLMEWAGRTTNRLARGRLVRYFGEVAIVRRAQSSGDSILLVNSLAGFRFQSINGVPLPISSTNSLPITIVAGTTITNRRVTGVIPLNSNFPDGPGELQLDGTLGATVAATAGSQSYVFVQGTDVNTPRPIIIRPNNKVSSEALAATDLPTLKTILLMRQYLVDAGVPPHAEDGTYHLHADAFFLAALTEDAAWKTATQGMGPSAILGAGTLFIPSLMLTLIENTDAPAKGKGRELVVGSAGSSGTGGVGTPGASRSMEDAGIDVINSGGVTIRRALMTGDESLIESYVSHADVLRMSGLPIVHQYGEMNVYDMNGLRFVAGEVDGWTLIIQPPMDPRALVSNITAAIDVDYVLGTDALSASNSGDNRLLRRAVGLEWGSTI